MPAQDGVDGVDQFGRQRFLLHVAGGTAAQHLHRIAALGVHRQHQYRQLRFFSLDLLQHFHATLVGHGDIEQHDIPVLGSHQANGFFRRAGLAADFHRRNFRNEVVHTCPYDRVVIDYKYFCHGIFER